MITDKLTNKASVHPVNGYTLIEVLVAMMILAMALTVLMQIFSTGLKSVGTSADYVHAVLLAESRLAVVGSDGTAWPREASGNDRKFRWTTTVEEYEAAESAAAGAPADLSVTAYQVTVVVEWPGPAGRRRVDLSTLKLSRSPRVGG
jgi:general secretion pathway protein I